MTPTNQRPAQKILQTAFVVKDVHESARAFLEYFGIGPWFVFEHYPAADLKYRERPVVMDFTIAAAYSGSMMIELIQQNDNGPSAYRDVIAARGYGFHHFAIASHDYHNDLARYRSLAFAIAGEAVSPADHGGGRAAYVDTTAKLPGMIELMEMNPQLAAALAELEATAANWDGKDPIRVQKFI